MVQASVMRSRRSAQAWQCMGFLAAMATAAGAQGMPMQCYPREEVVAHLADKFGETAHGMGLAANNTVLEVFVSDASGTWTIAVTLPTGVTCLVASGRGWDGTVAAPQPKGDPT